jgi:Glycosyl transferase family 11
MKIYVLCDGGLGNQLFQYACARALAIKTGGEVVLDPWRSRRGRSRPIQLQHFNIQARFASSPETVVCRLVDSSRLRPIAKIARHIVPGAIPTVVRQKVNEYLPNVFDVPGSLFLDGWWQSELYFAEHRERLLTELGLRESPDPINQKYLDEILGSEAVSIHVRRGDYVTDPYVARALGVCGLEYYQAAIDLVRQRVASPAFFIFSDDPEWTRQNLPVPEPRQFISHNCNQRHWEDLRLMSACKHFMIANSSFSWWGAWLATNPDKLVVAPKRWFADQKYSDKDVVPTSWLRL